jgi:Domain of unknown function (DUF4186)
MVSKVCVPHEVNATMTNVTEELKPLNIKCTSTDCKNNLHCFQLTQKMKKNGPAGRCRTCGAQLVDWARVHRGDLADVNYTFEALRYELIRHHFWHVPVKQYAVNYARRKGRIALKEAARKQIAKAVKDPNHPRQGQQTHRETHPHANVIHYAQHATASCCRRCLEEWHGIPLDRELTSGEIHYLTDLAMLYVRARVPDLAEGPVHVPNLHTPTDIAESTPGNPAQGHPHAG